MSRPPRKDRNTVASRYVGIRLNQNEWRLMIECVEVKNRQMKEIGLPPIMTGTALIKSLLMQEAERLGLHSEPVRRVTGAFEKPPRRPAKKT